MSQPMSWVVLTSFNASGYERYARRMIETFLEYWPEQVLLVAVSEDPVDIIKHDRVMFENYADLAPEGEHFKRKFGQFSEARGVLYNRLSDDQVEIGYSYVFDSIRFSHKAFSIYGVSRKWDCDRLIWLDADTFTHTPIDDRFFASVDPGTGHASYLGREHMYSECGFICYNRRHPVHEPFMNQTATEYLNGEIFLLPQWHDCWMFDIMREHFHNTNGAQYRNLSANVSQADHPFINCVLGEYMDHLKGEARKEAGRSFDDDKVASDAG